ncbi:MAG: OsmC family protein [Terriglobales bacterium]
MQRKGSAVWTGGLRDGHGTMSTASGVLDNTPYSFATRSENGKGTNPEELIGAAHAGCFSMAFSAALEKAGSKPDRIATEAAVSLEKVGDGFAITAVHLTVKGKVPGIDDSRYQEIAAAAKANCPVSKVLNAKITMEATLES